MANQATDLTLRQERVDETPLLLAQLRKMHVPQLLDDCFSTHGNWQGLSLGHLVTVWRTFILAAGKHRLSHLRDGVAARSLSLQAALGVTFVETAFTADRLAQALASLHDEAAWTLDDRDALDGLGTGAAERLARTGAGGIPGAACAG